MNLLDRPYETQLFVNTANEKRVMLTYDSSIVSIIRARFSTI